MQWVLREAQVCNGCWRKARVRNSGCWKKARCKCQMGAGGKLECAMVAGGEARVCNGCWGKPSVK